MLVSVTYLTAQHAWRSSIDTRARKHSDLGGKICELEKKSESSSRNSLSYFLSDDASRGCDALFMTWEVDAELEILFCVFRQGAFICSTRVAGSFSTTIHAHHPFAALVSYHFQCIMSQRHARCHTGRNLWAPHNRGWKNGFLLRGAVHSDIWLEYSGSNLIAPATAKESYFFP